MDQNRSSFLDSVRRNRNIDVMTLFTRTLGYGLVTPTIYHQINAGRYKTAIALTLLDCLCIYDFVSVARKRHDYAKR